MRVRGKSVFAIALAVAAPAMLGAVGRDNGLDARLLAAHNRTRDEVGAPALVWDARLAREARDWAEQLARGGGLRHSGGLASSGQGENLWTGSAGFFSPEQMMAAWTAEKRDFRPGVFPAVSRTGDWARVGHYTQIIWARTRRVGCALAGDQNREVLVCRYADPGNVYGERPV